MFKEMQFASCRKRRISSGEFLGCLAAVNNTRGQRGFGFGIFLGKENPDS
jgi:hypothetical protein